MTRTRILMIVENSYPDDPRVRREATTLKDSHEVTVIALRKSGERWTETLDGVRVIRIPRLPMIPVGKFHYFLEYAYLTLAALGIFLTTLPFRRYRVIHAHNPPDTLFLVGLAGKLFGCRFVFDHHDLSPELYLTRFSGRKDMAYRVLLWLERQSYRRADMVITTNESYRALTSSRHGVDPSRIHVVRNDPDPSRLPGGGGEDHPPHPLPEGGILFLGAINPQDGVEILLDAIRLLVHERGRTDLKCYVLGDGDSLPGLRRMAGEMGIEGNVEFKGFVSDRSVVNQHLAQCAAGVEPAPENPLNRHSTFIKIMEYMASGKAFVAFDLPETRRSGEGCGILVPPGDLQGFADGIESLLSDKGLAGRLGAAGRVRIQSHLNWNIAAKALNDAYQAL